MRLFRLAQATILLLALPQLALAQDLDELLRIDRYQYYLRELSPVVAKRGREDLAKALKSITPEQLHELKLAPVDLDDPGRFDALTARVLKARYPKLKFDPADVAWNYNFFKRKLFEGFVVKPEKPSTAAAADASAKPGDGAVVAPTQSERRVAITDQRPQDMTLDVDQYSSNRTTRAAFWHAILEKLPIELHLGPLSELGSALEARGARIVGEIKPLARNYNKIYLVDYPDAPQRRLVIGGISGLDRVTHLALQVGLTSWGGSRGASLGDVHVIGDPAQKLLADTAKLEKTLELLPPADVVVVGQKGAIGSVFRAAAKAQAVQEILAKRGAAARARLQPPHLKAIEKIGRFGIFQAYKVASIFEKAFEALSAAYPEDASAFLQDAERFTLDNESHELSDYVYRDAQGRERRWRVISNMWGDEVVPIAKALKATGVKEITYIGTAGAFPGHGLSVGDLFIPDVIVDTQGRRVRFKSAAATQAPDGAIIGGEVAHVASPFEESQAWLAEHGRVSRAVELETAYLAEALPDVTIKPWLLVSDVVGSEEETLGQANSSDRRSALNRAIDRLLDVNGASGVDVRIAPRESTAATRQETLVQRALIKQFPSRDPVSLYQLTQLALLHNVRASTALKALGEKETAFTASLLGKRLRSGSDLARRLRARLEIEGLKPDWVGVSHALVDGTWNPRSELLAFELGWADEQQAARAEAIAKDFSRGLSAAERKQILFRIAHRAPSSAPQAMAPADILRSGAWTEFAATTYLESAARQAGLIAGYTASGTLKFTQVELRETVIGVSPGAGISPIECLGRALGR